MARLSIAHALLGVFTWLRIQYTQSIFTDEQNTLVQIRQGTIRNEIETHTLHTNRYVQTIEAKAPSEQCKEMRARPGPRDFSSWYEGVAQHLC